jgi:hypothetical protein
VFTGSIFAALLTIFTVPVFYLAAAMVMARRPKAGHWPWRRSRAVRAGV